MTPAPLDKNLDALHRATSEVRSEFSGHDVVKRFFHLLLLECAERMTAAEFRQSIEIARQQLRKPA